MMNKLDYSPVAAKAEGDAAQPDSKSKAVIRAVNWNQRPRDVANLAFWASSRMERHLNWQIVNLNASADDLHDAPILYIAGSEALQLRRRRRQPSCGSSSSRAA